MRKTRAIAAITTAAILLTGCGSTAGKPFTDPLETAKTEELLPFTVSDSKTNLSPNEITGEEGIYLSVIGARAMDQIEFPYADSDSYMASLYAPSELTSEEEAIYPIIQIYNGTEEGYMFFTKDISLYSDSVQIEREDLDYFTTIDGVFYPDNGVLDPGESVIISVPFKVNRDWTELTVFYGNMSWKILQEDIAREEQPIESPFEVAYDHTITNEETIIYSGEDIDIRFDGAEIFERYDKEYIAFLYTFTNTTDEVITLDIGTDKYYMLRAYQDSVHLTASVHFPDEVIQNHQNMFNDDSFYNRLEIHPGMSAKVYAAFEVSNTEGVFECYLDPHFPSDADYIFDDHIDNRTAYAAVDLQPQ